LLPLLKITDHDRFSSSLERILPNFDFEIFVHRMLPWFRSPPGETAALKRHRIDCNQWLLAMLTNSGLAKESSKP
jgi:hypothetical protein